MLSDVESALMFYNSPKVIRNFIEYCKQLVGEMKGLITRSSG